MGGGGGRLLSGRFTTGLKKTFHKKLHSNANQNTFLNFLALSLQTSSKIEFISISARGGAYIGMFVVVAVVVYR